MKATNSEATPGTAVVVCLFVLASAGVAALAVAALAAPVTEAWRTSSHPLTQPEDRLAAGVVLGSAALLAALWLWLTVCVLVEVLDQGAGWLPRWASGPAARACRPAAIRTLVALVVGSAVALPVPADAGERPILPSALDGLPLPDRVAARAVSRRSTVRVQVGDTLWGIAAARLPLNASPRVVDQRWRRIYRENRSAVGPDPDLLTPGTRLRVSRVR